MKTIFNTNFLRITLLLLLSIAIVGSCKKTKEEPGKVSVYTSSDLDVGDIEIYLNGDFKGTIADYAYVATTPECSSSLCVNATLPEEGSASFKAVADDGSEWIRTLSVPDGDCQLINLTLASRTKVPPPSSGMGQVVFWENSATGCQLTTGVTINGTTNNITNFSASTPSCGSSGNATFSLAPGSYNYSASCSGVTKTGTVTVITNQCTPVQLNWSSPPSGTGEVVFWETQATGCPGFTDVVINGVTKQVTTFSASTPQCGSNGNATFSLSPGVYYYSANCSGTSKTGTISVTAGQCTPVQLIWSGGGNDGYNCISGNCTYTSSNAQYSTLSACQNVCSGGPPNASITFQNNSQTPMTITFSGTTKTASAGGTAVFTGTPNTTGTGNAETSGVTTGGTQVGSKLIWNLSYQYPSSGNSTINLNVGSDWFFVKMRNNGTKPLVNFYVNYGLNSQSLDNISIQNNNTVVNIGYYKAWSNSNVRADLQGTSTNVTWTQGIHFNLPWTQNQVANLLNTALMEIEASAN